MKTITKQIKISALLFAIVFSAQTKAQCAASFTHSQGVNGLVNFYSTSTPTFVPMSFNWNLGNNAVVGNTANPSTTYTANGTYTVFLTINTFTPFCTSTASAVITITNAVANPCLLNPNFSFTQGVNGLVNFNNTSTGTVVGTTYSWNFGDNTFNNTLSPSHTYSANGSYTVKLIANNNFTNTCIDSTQFVVNVTSYCNLSTGFSFTQGANGLVNFVSTTTGTVVNSTFSWAFGNNNFGSGSSTAHTYANGVYTVILTVTNGTNAIPVCSASIAQTLAITNANLCNLNANFSTTQGANGLVNFNNTSTGTVAGTTYSWNFGDNGTANTASPVHTYSANGIYIATLTANNNFSIACIFTKTAAINVNSYCNLAANFSFTQGANGLVNFASTSTGTNAGSFYSWNFGNGSGNGIGSNRVYANGTYTVTLTVVNFSAVPTCSSSISKTLAVNSFSCPINASFVHTVGISGLVNFSSTTTNTTASTTYTWNFGDGFISNLINPAHAYVNAGAYQVTLRAKDILNFGCFDIATQVLNITGVPCVANSNFTLVPTNQPKFWNAIPAYPWNVSSASWSWGDGTTTNSLYCSHLYSVAATYTICLTVTVSCGASSSFCASYFINKSMSGTAVADMLSINVVPPETIVNIENMSNSNAISFNAYPNPNNGKFKIDISAFNGENFAINMYDLMGEEVYFSSNKTTDTDSEKNIEVDNLPDGVYFLNLTCKGYTSVKKIVIAH